jgi:hypothetical protein
VAFVVVRMHADSARCVCARLCALCCWCEMSNFFTPLPSTPRTFVPHPVYNSFATSFRQPQSSTHGSSNDVPTFNSSSFCFQPTTFATVWPPASQPTQRPLRSFITAAIKNTTDQRGASVHEIDTQCPGFNLVEITSETLSDTHSDAHGNIVIWPCMLCLIVLTPLYCAAVPCSVKSCIAWELKVAAISRCRPQHQWHQQRQRTAELRCHALQASFMQRGPEINSNVSRTRKCSDSTSPRTECPTTTTEPLRSLCPVACPRNCGTPFAAGTVID